VLLFGDAFDLVSLSGQSAQLIGVSAAGFDFSLDIIGIKEKKGFQRGGMQLC
jgi:hypothetical protein